MWLAELRYKSLIRYRATCEANGVTCASSLISDLSVNTDLQTFRKQLAEKGISVIGSGFFGIVVSHPCSECVFKLPYIRNCQRAQKEHEVYEQLGGQEPIHFSYARVPKSYPFQQLHPDVKEKFLKNGEMEEEIKEMVGCQLTLERIYPLTTNGALIQVYGARESYYFYSSGTPNGPDQGQLRGEYMGMTQLIDLEERLRTNFDALFRDMGSLLSCMIFTHNIFPRDVEWVIGRTSRNKFEPCAFLMDFNQASISRKPIGMSKIFDVMCMEPIWPHPCSGNNKRVNTLCKIFWDAFVGESTNGVEGSDEEIEDLCLLRTASAEGVRDLYHTMHYLDIKQLFPNEYYKYKTFDGTYTGKLLSEKWASARRKANL